MAVIRLIRHGQASFGSKDYDQLSDLGREQARLLGRSLRRRAGEVDLVICGEMKRHEQTAELALEAMGLDLAPQTDHRWNEFDHEDVIIQHKPSYRSRGAMIADLAIKRDPRRQFQLFFDDALESWITDEQDRYAESWGGFVERVGSGLADLGNQALKARNILVFTSGGPVSAAAAELLGLDAEGWKRLNRTCANCSETKIVTGGSGVSLVTWNAHPWFDGASQGLLSYR